jgi:hypothetical protein
MIFLSMHLRVRKIVAAMHVERRNPAAVNAAAISTAAERTPGSACGRSCIRL